VRLPSRLKMPTMPDSSRPADPPAPPQPARRARLTVIGAGAWGTAVAALLAARGHDTVLWTRSPAQAQELVRTGRNTRRLPGVDLPPSLRCTADPLEAAAGAEAAFVAVPGRHLAGTLERFPDFPVLVSLVKGFADSRLQRMTGLLGTLQPEAGLAALSGPNLAAEVAAGKPAAAVAASESRQLAERVQGWLHGPGFRVYASTDLTGVETGGAVKNVIALAAGMCRGLGLGHNAAATVITRGLHELVRIGLLLGGRPETFYGLSGLGDMVATCSGPDSRNFLSGMRLAAGWSPERLSRAGLTVEGLSAVRRLTVFAEENGVSLPISREVHDVTFEGKTPAAAVRHLMERTSQYETGGSTSS